MQEHDNAVEVRRFRGGAGLARAIVVWSQRAEGMDIALLEIIDPAWRPQSDLGPVRWGRLVGSAGVACEAVGFPNVQVVTDDAGATVMRDLEHLSGWIHPLTTGKIGMLGISMASSPPVPTPDEKPSPWGGMSGAALFCGPLLTGVISTHPAGFDTSRLTAVPVSRLLDDGDAMALLADQFGQPPIAEPAELAPLAAAVWPANSPASLLRADVEAVGFRGRAELLARLRDWCSGPGRYSARLVSGPGGQGKTRLTRELGHRMRREGWAVLHVVPDLPEHADAYRALARVDVPLLVVIDYAETRVRQVGLVIEALHSASGPVRLLLVARTGGAWVHELASTRPALESILGGSLVEIAMPELLAIRDEPQPMTVPVSELADTVAERQAMFDDAVSAFAARLSLLPAYTDVDWVDAAATVVRPDLSPPRYETALSVQMAALATLLDHDNPDRASAPAAAEDVLLGHERRYWHALARSRGVDTLPDLERLSGWLVAVAAVCAADTEDIALATLHTLPVTADQDAAMRSAVARWLHDLYPAQHAYWGSPQPDRLAEHLVAAVLADRPDLFDRVLPCSTRFPHGPSYIAVERPGSRPCWLTTTAGRTPRIGPPAHFATDGAALAPPRQPPIWPEHCSSSLSATLNSASGTTR